MSCSSFRGNPLLYWDPVGVVVSVCSLILWLNLKSRSRVASVACDFHMCFFLEGFPIPLRWDRKARRGWMGGMTISSALGPGSGKAFPLGSRQTSVMKKALGIFHKHYSASTHQSHEGIFLWPSAWEIGEAPEGSAPHSKVLSPQPWEPTSLELQHFCSRVVDLGCDWIYLLLHISGRQFALQTQFFDEFKKSHWFSVCRLVFQHFQALCMLELK